MKIPDFTSVKPLQALIFSEILQLSSIEADQTEAALHAQRRVWFK